MCILHELKGVLFLTVALWIFDYLFTWAMDYFVLDKIGEQSLFSKVVLVFESESLNYVLCSVHFKI
jgi:hypothetical protein